MNIVGSGFSRTLLLVAAGLLSATLHAQPVAPAAAPAFAQDSMNAFRRYTGDGTRTLEFYGDVLGLRALSTVPVGRGQVARLQVGTSQLKFTAAGANAHYTRGAIDDAVGVRLWTIWFPDEAALTAQFVEHGLPAPRFSTVDDTRSALVADPDGEWVRLVVVANAPKDTYERFEVGIAAADLARSRAFYRQFVGLEELPPVADPVLGVTRYPYRHGTTIISLWAAPGPRPANPGLAGIQYVVSNVDAVSAFAQERMIPVEQPLANTLPGLRTVWLLDPDQVTNYFAQIVPRVPR
jgi:catechol 2,3-dioxygenase-like lactoylglutathione lyase family enzyme